MKKLLFFNLLLLSASFSYAENIISAQEALKMINEQKGITSHTPHLLREHQQKNFLKACGDQSFNSSEDLVYQYCKAFVSSDICKNIEPERRMNCNKDLNAHIIHAPENGWNCIKGLGQGLLNALVVAGRILKLMLSPIDSTNKGLKAGAEKLAQLQNYVNTGYVRELQIINRENPPADSDENVRRATRAVVGNMFGYLINNAKNYLSEKSTAFACLNDDNKFKRSCELITNAFFIKEGAWLGYYTAKGTLMVPGKVIKQMSQPKNLSDKKKTKKEKKEAKKEKEEDYGMSYGEALYLSGMGAAKTKAKKKQNPMTDPASPTSIWNDD